MAQSKSEIEAELRQANAFLDAIVENIPDMIFVKRADDHAFVRFNRAGEELLGWTRAELLGKTDHDAQDKCTSAKASCREAKQRCCNCSGDAP